MFSKDRELHEECGVFAVCGYENAAAMCYYGLHSLQHRGQEAAGIVVKNKEALSIQKGEGLVTEVFDQDKISKMKGDHAIGHVRYSTAGGGGIANVQPLLFRTLNGSLGIAHNGNIVNANVLKADLEKKGSIFSLFAFWSHKGGNPILTQMWFVRDLLLLVICAPIIYLLARYAKFVAIFCFGLIWFVKWEVPNWESGLLFFFIGACFSIYGKSITEEVRKIAPFLFILTPLLLLADFLLSGTTTGFYVHRTLIFVGVFFIIALVTVLIEKKKIHDIVFLTSGSFFLYIIHDPMIRFVRKFTLRWIDHTSEFQAIAIYFAAVAIDVAVAYFVFWCLRKCAPGFLKWSTGGR